MVCQRRFLLLRISEKLDLASSGTFAVCRHNHLLSVASLEIGKGHVRCAWLRRAWSYGGKFAAAFGAEVTMLSHSPSKQKDAERLSFHHFVLTSDKNN